MSPDDANPTETEPAGDAEETKPKKSLKERMAFMSKGGEKMDKVPGINKIPRSMRLLFVIIIVVVLLAAIIGVAMMMGGDEKPGPSTNNIDPAKLEDFTWSSGPTTGTASEFQAIQMSLDGMLEGNGTVLVDGISLALEWQDEPDQTWAGRVRENSPDSFQLMIDIGTGNYTVESQMTPNDAGSKQGNVALALDMASTNFTYVAIGNTTGLDLPEGVFDLPIDIFVIMGEAGDLYASGPAAFKLNDFVNDYTLTVSVTGKVIPDDDSSNPE
jgi:hypothetical protein